MVSYWVLYRTEARSPRRVLTHGGRKRAFHGRIRHAVGVQEVGARKDRREPQPLARRVWFKFGRTSAAYTAVHD